jgi:hypothetical protein
MNSRRNFIKTIVRSLVAGTVIGTSGYLLFKEPSGELCEFDLPCGNCKQLSSCKQPKAKDFKKKNLNGGGNEHIQKR